MLEATDHDTLPLFLECQSRLHYVLEGLGLVQAQPQPPLSVVLPAENHPGQTSPALPHQGGDPTDRTMGLQILPWLRKKEAAGLLQSV
jgi:hypothetical protein